MNLRHLEHAVLLAAEGSFAKAAARAHLTQSALSRSIQALEQDLGVTLFDRTPQGAVPTGAGRRLLARARGLLDDAGFLRRDMALLRDGYSGEVAFGVGPAIAARLPEVLADLTRRSPSLRIRVEVDGANALDERLRSEAIDFYAVARSLVAREDGVSIRSVDAQAQNGGFFVRSGHPLAGYDTIDLAALQAYPLIGTRVPAGIRDALQQMFGAQSQAPDPFHVVCEDIFLLVRLLLLSDTVLCTGAAMLDREIAEGSVVRLPIAAPRSEQNETWQPAFVWRTGRTLTPAAQAVIDALSAACLRQGAKGVATDEVVPDERS